MEKGKTSWSIVRSWAVIVHPDFNTHLKYHHYPGTTYHRFRALNAPNYEHSTHKTNTTNSELVCSLVSIRRFVPLWVLFVPPS